MRVTIDRRPIWLILAIKGIRPILFLGLAAIFLYLIGLQPPAGLSSSGLRCIAVFVVCLFLWVTNLIPLAVTSIFAIVMVPLLRILSERETYSLFGNEAVFFILGAFILAGAVMHSGLSKRLALTVMKRYGATPRGLVRAVFILAAVLSFFMSEHAVAAMLFPIVLEIAKGLNLRPGRSNYGKLLFISLAWGSVIGGVATFLGGARVPLAVGILKETSGITIDFIGYTWAVLPLVVIMLFLGYFLLFRLFPLDLSEVAGAEHILSVRLNELGRITFREYAIGSIMFVTVLCWIVWGRQLGLATIALASVVSLFLFRLVRWKDIEEYVNWGIILMYGGAIILGSALSSSGAAEWMAGRTIGVWATSPLMTIALVSLAALLFTESMSNAAVIAILIPVGIGIAGEHGINPQPVTYAIAIAAGLAFSLPMSTPANALAVSSNYLNVRDMARAGMFMSITAWIVLNVMARFYWPLIGFGF